MVDPQLPRRLLRLLPEARGPVLRLGLVAGLQGGATIAQAFALTALVVAVVSEADLAEPVGWLLVVLAARAVLAALLETAAGRAGVRISTALRSRLVRQRLQGPVRPLGSDQAAALTLATSGVTSVEPYVARFLPAALAGLVIPLLAIGTLAVVDVWSALIVLLTVPLLPLFAALIGQHTAEATSRRWRALTRLSGHFLDVMRGLPTLVSYGRAVRQADTVAEVSGRLRTATMQTLRQAFLSTAVLELLSTLCVAIVAVTVGVRLAGGSMDLTTGLVAILLAPEAYWPVRRVGAEFHAAADGVDALDRALAELESAAQHRPTPATVVEHGRATPDPADDETTLTVTNLCYRFPDGTRPVLDGLSARFGRGLSVVVGPSGAGKSTLLELLAGLREPSAGRVDGRAAHLVTQRPFLVPGTVELNLTMGNRAERADVWRALRVVGLDALVADLPGGLDSTLGDDGIGLSAGQRARLALARALLSAAPVVLLDEPTAHLDPLASAQVHDAIRALARDRTVVVITHRPELLDAADQRVALGQGAMA